MCNKNDIRKNQFLDWAEEHLTRITLLTLPPQDRDHGSGNGKRHLREIKKTAVLSLLDTLARAFEGGGQQRNKEAFVRLVEGQGWPDAKRLSVVHLARALQMHFQIKPQERWAWVDLYDYLRGNHRWTDGKYCCENSISVDPDEREIMPHWPKEKNGSLCKIVIDENGKSIPLRELKHSHLLYSYRNVLVHESREPNFSYENDDDKEPLYMTVGGGNDGRCEYHLVYPLGFLIGVTNRCIQNIRDSGEHDPYSRFAYGCYIIPELNAREPMP